MSGHIRRRTAGSWEIKFDVGRDAVTGERLTKFKTVRGTKRDAERELRNLLTAVDSGSYVSPAKITIAEHVRSRVNQWESSGDISARTAQRYRQLVENQIVPYIGEKLLQKLKRLDIEAWHTELRTSGRRRGPGGVAARTIGHAHRVLSKALSDATKDDLIARNVCKIEAPPKVESAEMSIVRREDIGGLVERLAGHPLRGPAVVALFTGMRLESVWKFTDE